MLGLYRYSLKTKTVELMSFILLVKLCSNFLAEIEYERGSTQIIQAKEHIENARLDTELNSFFDPVTKVILQTLCLIFAE